MPRGAHEPERLTTPLAGLRVFVSYPRGGAAHTWAERVQADLGARGAEVWRDETGVAAGDGDWYSRIRDGLERAHIVLGIFGLDSEACRWQQREMLHADELGLPVLAATVGGARLPLYAKERQPIALRDGDASTTSLDALLAALLRLAPEAAPTAAAGNAVPAEQRRTEVAWLNSLLHQRLSLHEAVYEPLAARQHAATLADRLHQVVSFDTGMVLTAFGQAGARAEPVQAPTPQPFDDVLDAYRSLPQRRVPRLVVLGEPGAGKSFSLERIACDHARRALHDVRAPLPLLLRLGLWTRADETIDAFAERQLEQADDQRRTGMGRCWAALRDQRRAVLLLDGLNEIPLPQRADKAAQLIRLCDDPRWVAVVVSCRERDYAADFHLPFDRLTLLPLTPIQVHRCLLRAYTQADDSRQGAERAEQRFWQIAGGEKLREVWRVWQAAGASVEQFWTADDIPKEQPNVYAKTSGEHDRLWREARDNPRSLLRLATNPYLLSVMMVLEPLPASRAQLFDGFLQVLHERERKAREARHDGRNVPELAEWLAALTRLAEVLQHLAPDGQTVVGAGGADASGGAATSLRRAAWPPGIAEVLDFSRDASVLQLAGDDLRFTHQLLQEALASRVLLRASASWGPLASNFWMPHAWWQRNGWEVVAEIAAEACAGDSGALWRLLAWLAETNPLVAAEAWCRAGSPVLPTDLAVSLQRRWQPKLCDARAEPFPPARAAIGRALGLFGLDDRPGIGLRADGLPGIDWVRIETPQGFVYQAGRHPPLQAFDIARYPVTHRQFQAFVDAGAYADARWWQGLARHFDAPADAAWTEPNVPRERVSWVEAVAFCRWLSAALNEDIRLPTEQQWERAAAGTDGRAYPWGKGYRAGAANCNEVGSQIVDGAYLGRTTAVGIYPLTSAEGVADLAGNVWEWCLNEYEKPENIDMAGEASRVLRGGSWDDFTQYLRAAYRNHFHPDVRYDNIGFRVCRVAPIEKRVAGKRATGALKR